MEALLEWHRKKKEEMEERGGGGERSGVRLRQQGLSSFHYPAGREGHLVGQKTGRGSASSPFFPSPSLLLSQTDARGRSALYLSAAYGHHAVVSLLLTMGADPRARSKEGKTARDKAEARGEKEVVGLLKQYEDEPGRIRVLCGMRTREGKRKDVAVDVGVENVGLENQLQQQQQHQQQEEEEEKEEDEKKEEKEEEEEEKEKEKKKEKRMGVGEGEEGILSRRRLQRERCRGWRQVTGVEGGVQDGKEEEEDEDGDADDEKREEEDEEEEEGNVYGAISRPWSWRVWRRRMVKVGVEEGWREEGQGESAEQYSESGRVGGINEGLKKYEKEGEEDNRKAMKKVGEVAHLVVATLPDDLFVELAGFMRLPWDEDEGEEGWRVEDRRSK